MPRGIFFSNTNPYKVLFRTSDELVYFEDSPVVVIMIFNKLLGGENTSYFLDSNSQAWSWGYNLYGRLGDNTTTDRSVPGSVCGIHSFITIANGEAHVLAIDNLGQVWAWGDNFYGELGDDTSSADKCTPISIHGTKKTFCYIAGGEFHSSAIDYKGQVWGWGYNKYWSLGDTTTTNRCTPVSIHGTKKTFCYISSGYFCSFAKDYNNNLWSWGYNTYGQLGDGTTSSRCTPVQVSSISGAYVMSVMTHHVLSLDSNGQVWSWGLNDVGQLGDGTTNNRCIRGSIYGTKTFCKIAVGDFHSLAIDKNGQIWSWGENGNYQLGDTTNNDKCIPVSIHGTKKTFCYISCGGEHSLALDYQGQFWAWGKNSYGELGNNTSGAFICTPVAVCV